LRARMQHFCGIRGQAGVGGTRAKPAAAVGL
jgi:hypothetical protein